MSSNIVLPEGWHDAKGAILTVAILGEALQGGLMFGWNALAVMLVELGNFSNGCEDTPAGGLCKSQESKLAVLWTVGIFSLNCGPVIMGFVLDFLGPKFTGILGVFLNMLGLVLFAISGTDGPGLGGPNAFVPAAIIMGLGGITFHLAQFHISALFPRQRGLVSAVFVSGFTGCGIIMYILQTIFHNAGATRDAYRAVLLGYAGICALWIPFIAWMMPNDSFKVGVVYLFRKDWRFEVRNRSELSALSYRRTTSLQDFVAASVASRAAMQNGVGQGGGRQLTHRVHRGVEMVGPPPEHASAGLVAGGVPDSSHPMWLEAEDTFSAEQQAAAQGQQQQQAAGPHPHQNGGSRKGGAAGEGSSGGAGNGAGAAATANGPAAAAGPPHTPPDSPPTAARLAVSVGLGGEPISPARGSETGVPLPPNAVGPDGTEIGPESVPLPSDVVWGPLVFESRRFVELRKKSFKEQFFSNESFGMGVFYTLNVFFLQFYLGTMRLQLENKGDYTHSYTNFGNVVVAFAFMTIPIIGWLLDKKGYGITLGSINALAVATSVFQALPPLGIQVFSIVLWMVARFFMYSSYFAIFGALFGFRNFGRLVAIDNTFNGLFGLLQYPLTYLGIHTLDGNFTAINIGQAIVLLPLFAFCYAMYKWEREDLVPIRPMEGEELPIDMLGPRQRRRKINLNLPNLHWPHLPGRGSSQREALPTASVDGELHHAPDLERQPGGQAAQQQQHH